MKPCPWDQFTKGTTTFCEAHLCSWVESPAIAWAAVAYIITALLLIKHLNVLERRDVLLLSPIVAITMGVGSFGYHATHTLFFQFIDVLAMLAFGMMILLFNLNRLNKISKSYLTQIKLCFVFLSVKMALFLYLGGGSGPIMLVVLIFLYLISEYLVFISIPQQGYKFFKISLVSFALAGMALWIERGSGLCNPDNHLFQWHAVWDSFSAVVFFTLPFHLGQKQLKS